MTVDEMAKQLGVSKSTISRALSGKGRVGKETQERIKAYAEQCGHVPMGEKSKKKKTGATNNIGVILPSDVYVTGSPYFHECLLGICETAGNMNYNVLIATETMDDVSAIKGLVDNHKVDGIILTRNLINDIEIDYLCKKTFPVAVTGTTPLSDVIQVDADIATATETLLSVLVGKGYRRFAIFLDDMRFVVNKERYRGFESAIYKNGLDLSKQLIYTNLTGLRIQDYDLQELFAQKVECVISGDDIICTKLMSSLQGSGYHIPKDIAIASLHDSVNLSCFMPSVTAVNIAPRQMGVMVAKQLIHALEGKEYNKMTNMDYGIIIRKSTNEINREENGSSLR